MRKFLTSFWGMFAVLFALVLMGANTPFLVGNANYPISWFNSVRLVLPWRQATELPNQRVRIETGNTNWLRNPGFEAATISPWTTSGSPTTSFPSASYEGAQALSISQASGSGKYVQGCVTTSEQVGGTNLEMSAFVMGSTASGYQVCSVVDGVEKQCVSAPDNGNQYTQVTATAIAPTTVLSNDNVCIRIKSTSSGAVGIYVDDAYLGPNRNIGTVAHADLVFSGYIPSAANCAWNRSGSTQSAMTADVDCANTVTTTYINNAYAVLDGTTSDLPRFKFSSLASGKYVVTVSGGSILHATTAGILIGVSLYDTSTSTALSESLVTWNQASNGGIHLNVSGTLIKESQGPSQIEVFGGASSGSFNLFGDSSSLNIKVVRYPSQSEQVLRMNCSGAACGTNDFSARVSTSGTVSSENVDWINGNCSMSGTNNARATCTFNTSLFSVTPNCTLTAYACPSESGGCPRTINIASLNTSTIVTQGVQNNDLAYQPSDMVISCHRVGSDRVAANMPLVKGGVTSGYSGVTKASGAVLNCDSGSVVSSQHDTMVASIGNISSGNCTVTLTTGYFSATPFCVGGWNGVGNQQAVIARPTSATSVTLFASTADGGTPSTAFDANLICIGPR